MRKLLQAFTVVMPWSIKRLLLVHIFKFEIDSTARIGLSWIFPNHLVMKAHSKIGHFNVAVHLDSIFMCEYSSIARSNWITGFSTKSSSPHFAHQVNRLSALSIGVHSAITKHHHIDCTSKISIGEYTTIAGYYSQLLTHSIDIVANRQDSHPINIGDYCFVGTNVVVLGGSILPDYSVLGAKSLLNKQYTDTYFLYGGVPAKKLMPVATDAKYFLRETGFVY
jgi:acetyltransferase-like isoleucine patch superfamily enzyme